MIVITKNYNHLYRNSHANEKCAKIETVNNDIAIDDRKKAFDRITYVTLRLLDIIRNLIKKPK